MISGWARSPARLNTGSPGSALIRKNAHSVIPNKRGIRSESLFRIYALMPDLP